MNEFFVTAVILLLAVDALDTTGAINGKLSFHNLKQT